MTKFLYAGNQAIAEYDGSDALLRRFVPGAGADEALVWYAGAGLSSRYWLTQDARGSLMAVVNSAGAATSTSSYDPYGAPVSTGASPRFGYTGQLYLPEIGLSHYKARAYNPETGRFMQPDPIGYAGGLNLYAYAGNDPVNRIDPTGLWCTTVGDGPRYCQPNNNWRQNLEIFGGSQFARSEWARRLNEQKRTNGGDDSDGHDYRTRNKVCDRPLTTAEQQDLLSRFAVPSVFSGQPIDNGYYLVTATFGSGPMAHRLPLPGGIVRTTFSSDGLSATNVTTPVHAFVGVIDRSFNISNNATYAVTHGYGNAGSGFIGQFRDAANLDAGPGIFNQLDSRAASYAAAHYPGCQS